MVDRDTRLAAFLNPFTLNRSRNQHRTVQQNPKSDPRLKTLKQRSRMYRYSRKR
ncbi:MAG: hypothetical protein U5R06_10245 [candidate division KSB1 bacterium]|nr:hypothetical protein [candidate division KSB1 bacterium]